MGFHGNDLPVFLGNPTRLPDLTEEPEPELDFRAKFTRLYAQSITALAPHAEAIKARLVALHAQLNNLPGLLQKQSVKEQISVFTLAAFLAPLALLSTLDRPQPPVKSAGAAAPEPPPPVFALDQRLAFAQNLRDRLLSNAIALAMKAPPPLSPLLKSSDVGQTPNENEQSEAPRPTEADDDQDVSGMSVQQITHDDGPMWSFPFKSGAYVVGELPRSPESSFRAELAMSDVMIDASGRANVADNEDAATAPVPKIKQNKLAKRKKVVAQKRRPPQSNQMTAAAAPQPTGIPGEPNLPPPPILFFLGAPPPQSAQPVQPPPTAAPAPAAAKAPPPIAPPASKPWAPNSLSDVFKDAY
ncbi:MAG: hypothetical protein JSR78_02445 [Proteobacteria bacterium]|nr:hypothetical protein [Pseudomonadota bacterium]